MSKEFLGGFWMVLGGFGEVLCGSRMGESDAFWPGKKYKSASYISVSMRSPPPPPPPKTKKNKLNSSDSVPLTPPLWPTTKSKDIFYIFRSLSSSNLFRKSTSSLRACFLLTFRFLLLELILNNGKNKRNRKPPNNTFWSEKTWSQDGPALLQRALGVMWLRLFTHKNQYFQSSPCVTVCDSVLTG